MPCCHCPCHSTPGLCPLPCDRTVAVARLVGIAVLVAVAAGVALGLVVGVCEGLRVGTGVSVRVTVAVPVRVGVGVGVSVAIGVEVLGPDAVKNSLIAVALAACPSGGSPHASSIVRSRL